jgi:flagellar hook-associated protein 2
MFFTYNGTGETTTVTSTQGIGNLVYTASNKYANTTSGTVQSLINDKQTQDLQFTSQYNNWVNEANNYTNFLLNQYSALTSKIQSAGQTLSTLNALFTAQYSSNG